MEREPCLQLVDALPLLGGVGHAPGVSTKYNSTRASPAVPIVSRCSEWCVSKLCLVAESLPITAQVSAAGIHKSQLMEYLLVGRSTDLACLSTDVFLEHRQFPLVIHQLGELERRAHDRFGNTMIFQLLEHACGRILQLGVERATGERVDQHAGVVGLGHQRQAAGLDQRSVELARRQLVPELAGQHPGVNRVAVVVLEQLGARFGALVVEVDVLVVVVMLDRHELRHSHLEAVRLPFAAVGVVLRFDR